MCIYESIEQRNEIVEANLWCIDAVIRANYALMQAARLDYGDVYQWLALRLIQAVSKYDPDKGSISLPNSSMNCSAARGAGAGMA